MVCTLALAVSLPAPAATIVARDVTYLAHTSDLVVRATVTGQTSAMRADGRPWTTSHLAVKTYLQGEGPDTLDVVQLGGAFPDGRVLVIPGDLTLQPGDDIVIFLTLRDGELYSALLSWSVFDVAEDGSLKRQQGDLALMGFGDDGRLGPIDPATIKVPRTLTDLAAELGGGR